MLQMDGLLLLENAWEKSHKKLSLNQYMVGTDRDLWALAMEPRCGRHSEIVIGDKGLGQDYGHGET